jgi:hypothetical protein
MYTTIGNRDYAKNTIEQAAARLNLSTDELQRRLNAAYAEMGQQAPKLRIVDAADLSGLMANGGSCKHIDFSVVDIVKVQGTVCFTPGADWTVAIDLHVSLAGAAAGEAMFPPATAHACRSPPVTTAGHRRDRRAHCSEAHRTPAVRRDRRQLPWHGRVAVQ